MRARRKKKTKREDTRRSASDVAIGFGRRDRLIVEHVQRAVETISRNRDLDRRHEPRVFPVCVSLCVCVCVDKEIIIVPFTFAIVFRAFFSLPLPLRRSRSMKDHASHARKKHPSLAGDSREWIKKNRYHFPARKTSSRRARAQSQPYKNRVSRCA